MNDKLRGFGSICVLPLLCGCSGIQSALDAHGASAAHLEKLIVFMIVSCALVWIAVVAVLGIALLRRRSPDDSLHRANDSIRRLRIVVLSATLATAVIIGIFTVTSFYTTRALSIANDEDLVIRLRGLQWWWDVKYLHRNGTFSTANEVHIPVGRNVRIQLEAADVIHSFWVPSLAGKQDMIPGRLNEITLRANRQGLYRGQCAEFCGLQHAHMAVVVIAEPQGQFDKWAAAQQQDASTNSDEEAQRGRRVFEAKACAACHTVRGTPAAGINGPDLTHVGSRKTIAAGVFDTTRGSLAAWIADPQTIKPGNNMPLVPLQPDELRAVSAYMMSLQ